MGALPVVYAHHLPGFTSDNLGSRGNKTSDVRSSVTMRPAARMETTFVGGCKLQQRSRRLSSFPSRSSYASHVCKSHLLQEYAPAASAGYAVLLLGGGLFAYNKSGSKGSLVGGLTGATLMSVAYYLMQAPETKELGDALAFGASLLFAVVFGIRLAATRKAMPAGLLLGVSVGLMAMTYSAYLQDRINLI